MAREGLMDDAGVDFIEPPCEKCIHEKITENRWAYCELDGICEFEECED